MDFDNHNNSEILHAVLLRTKGDYRRALYIFDKLVPLSNILYLTKCLNLCYCGSKNMPMSSRSSLFYHLSQCSIPYYRVIVDDIRIESTRIHIEHFLGEMAEEIHCKSCSKFPKFPQVQRDTKLQSDLVWCFGGDPGDRVIWSARN